MREMAKNTRPVEVSDLTDLLGKPPPHPFLLCDECFEQNSAHAGDYWNRKPDEIFMHCGKPMRLVKKETRFVDVKLPSKRKVQVP